MDVLSLLTWIRCILWLRKHVGLAGVSASQVEMKSGIQFYDGITTGEIQEILIKSASDLIDLDHPNYQFVAARLLLFSVRKQSIWKDESDASFRNHIMSCTNSDVYDKDILTNILRKKLIKQMVILIMIVIFIHLCWSKTGCR